MNIGIVGLGLIGGSMARSIKLKTLHNVFGIDIDSETMTFASLTGSIDSPLNPDTLPTCDFLFLAVAPHAAVAWMREHADMISSNTTVIDLCGVKRYVHDALAPMSREHGFTYIGGHPMAGTERSGFTSSTSDLFVGAAMILTPDSDIDIRLLETVKAFFLDIGFASLTFTTPEEHDRIIAYTSQLAHIVSGSYVKLPDAMKQRGFSAGSFRDMTRVARLDEVLWTELLLDNRDCLITQLKCLLDNMQDYLTALENEDAERLEALLREGREKKALAGGH